MDAPLTLIEATDTAEFVDRAVHLIADVIEDAIAERGRACIGLSGGSTPKPIYDALGKLQLPWDKVWIFLVDDRCIRADDPKSNQFLLRSTLLKHAPIPESHVIVPDPSLDPDASAALYAKHIDDLLKKGPADLTVLGMGGDGHIASLFPPVPEAAFSGPSALHTTTERFDVFDRISVGAKVLTSARQSLFLLNGKEKHDTWGKMMESTEDERRWPAKSIMNATPTIVILLRR